MVQESLDSWLVNPFLELPSEQSLHSLEHFVDLIGHVDTQIIFKSIDEERFGGKYRDEERYYQAIRNSIKKTINRQAKTIIIDIVPKRPIEELWIVECLLDLQSEFTKILVIPQCTVDFPEHEIFELKRFLCAEIIIKRVTQHKKILFF